MPNKLTLPEVNWKEVKEILDTVEPKMQAAEKEAQTATGANLLPQLQSAQWYYDTNEWGQSFYRESLKRQEAEPIGHRVRREIEKLTHGRPYVTSDQAVTLVEILVNEETIALQRQHNVEMDLVKCQFNLERFGLESQIHILHAQVDFLRASQKPQPSVCSRAAHTPTSGRLFRCEEKD